MSVSRKEEERNEKIIRGLMKLPPNRRCINCNSLGPQYVCTNFWTFVCMTCSGIHREFTHRVKSVSMSKFTSQEVEALQEGGNQRARETFLKDWDPRGQRLPDNSNADKIREFIKSVYVDKKFYDAKTSGKPPRDTMNPRNHEDETRRSSSYHSYSQSPPYDYQYEERRYGKQAPALTKKPGSDRGMFRFLSSSHISDHLQDGFVNEVSNARVSDYSAGSGGDPFRSITQSPTYQRDLGHSSPGSETSRDILSEDGQQYPMNTSLNTKGKEDLHQRTGSSGSIEQLNSDGMSVKSVDPIGKEFVAPTPEQSAVTHHNKESIFPSFPHSSESRKFDGLDLFSAPQTFSSTTSAVDFFQLSGTSSASSVNSSQPPHNSIAPNANQQSQPFGPSPLDLFSIMPQQPYAETLKDKSPDMSIQKDEGWATFDMPWHVEQSKGIESLIPVSEASTSNKSLGKFDQAPSVDRSSHLSFHQDLSANGPSSSMHNPWHEGLNNIGAPVNGMDQSWSPFEDSTASFQSIYAQSSGQVPVQDPSVANPYLAWGIAEDFKIKKDDLTATLPILGTTPPHAVGSSDASCELPFLDAAHSHGLDKKSHNPFDLPCDPDLESSNMPFLDMSSLQSALPNHNISTPWFPESTPIPYTPGMSQDALVFMAGPAPSRQIPNIPAQGPVASIGGNPFG